jgi:NAD(P)-dependent dehydrogenase (short-subunit alcohol dehydrogenase family)
MKGIAGKTVLITGGGTGIGRATALAFGGYGANVVISGRREEPLQETAELIGQQGGQAEFVQADATVETDVERLVNKAVERFGGLHFAFNNAGGGGARGLTGELSEADWLRVISLNLTSVFLSMRHELRVMQDGGVIVNNASAVGTVGAPGLAAYVAAKHGVIGLTKAAALEYAQRGVRVNAVAPGYVDTDLLSGAPPEMRVAMTAATPAGRFGRPEEVAEAVAFLCSDASAYTLGQVLLLDGGYTAQ